MRYGSTTYQGETYLLMDQAKRVDTESVDGNKYYVAPALKSKKWYHVYFEILHDTQKAHACDWHNATFVQRMR